MEPDSHKPYEGVIDLRDKISILIKRIHSFENDGFIGRVLAHHLALEIANESDLYNFLISDSANKTLDIFGVKVVNSVIYFNKARIDLYSPDELFMKAPDSAAKD